MGDAIQGGAIGTPSDGAFPVDIMNQAGYDISKRSETMSLTTVWTTFSGWQKKEPNTPMSSAINLTVLFLAKILSYGEGCLDTCWSDEESFAKSVLPG